jgi:hypothetical protein
MQPSLRMAVFASIASGAVICASGGRAIASTESVLYSFTGSGGQGTPDSVLLADAHGILYGATLGDAGGVDLEFALDQPGSKSGNWTFAPLYTFYGNTGPSGVVEDAQGDLYGTTYYHGTGSGCAGADLGCGFAFELSPSGSPPTWTETVLYNFGGPPDAGTAGGVLLPSAGGFYGTTSEGGRGFCGGFGCGTVYALAPTGKGQAWTDRVLFSFGLFDEDGVDPTASSSPTLTGTFTGRLLPAGRWKAAPSLSWCTRANRTGVGSSISCIRLIASATDSIRPAA